MTKHLIDVDEDRLGAARAGLGTTTIKDIDPIASVTGQGCT